MAINVPIISSWDGKGVSKAVKDFKKLETGSSKAAFGLLNADAAARRGVAAFAKFSAIGAGVAGIIGGKLVSAAYESQKVMKQTEAIIKATGGAARITAKQVADLSGRLSEQVGVDDELIQSSANLLLTFKQIQNQVGENNNIFDRALQSSLDLGNVFGSVDAAAMQLGKALSDPVRGITALRRAGINFTDQQRDQIKTLVASGKTLEAQKLILAEVESQVGGTAAATATGFDRMKVALENVAERLGELLIPYVERFANFVNTTVVPVLNQFSDIVGEKGIGAGFEFLTGKIIGSIWNMGNLGKAIIGVTGAFAALRIATITFTAVQGAMRIAADLTTDSLRRQAIQAAATKTAMLAAGGLTAVLAVAATGYAIYAKRKAEAVQRTKDFVAALQLEGEEQDNAIDNIYKNDRVTRGHIDTLTTMGLTIDDLSKYVEGNYGAVAQLSQTWKKADASAEGIYPSLQAFADALGISTADGYDQISMIRNMVKHFDDLRKEQEKQIRMQIGLAKARGDLLAAGRLEQQLYGMDPTIRGAVTQATEDQTGAQDDLNRSLNTQSRTVKTAQERFKDYVSALKGYGSDQKSYTSAIKDTTNAKRKLEQATNKVSVAQARYDQIVRGYGAGSDQAKAAQEALDQAQRDATRASLDSEKATFAVSDAEAELARLRNDSSSTAQDIREAEIALAEAKLSQTEQTLALRDANQAVADAQIALNEAINGATPASQSYKDALQELNDAKNEEAEAADAVAEAIDRETEAKLRLADAERDLAAARKGTTARQRERAERRTGVDDKSVGGKRREFLDMVNKDLGKQYKSIREYIDAGRSSTSKSNRKARFNEFARANNIPEMAKGGIVSAATLAVIGEKGPEAVVPLDRLAPTGGDTYNITINSKIADEALPDLLVAELRKFNRRSGAINIQVA